MKFEPVEYLELKIDKSKPVPKTYTTLVQNNSFQKFSEILQPNAKNRTYR